MQPTQGHPNAIASLITTGLAYALYRIASHYDWLKMSSATSLLIAGGIISSVLFIGRRGLKATIVSVWRGSEKQVGITPPSEPPAA